MSKVSGKALDWSLLRRVMSYTKPIRATFYFAAFITITLAFLGPLRPYLISMMVDDYIREYDKSGLVYWTLVIVGILLVEGLLQFFQTYLANFIGQTIIKKIRTQLYNKITNFRLRYFDRTAIGRLVTRAVSDIETIANIFSQGILTIMGDLLKLAVVVLFMFIMNWKFSLLVLLPVPILLYATRLFKNAMKRAFQDVRKEVSRLNTFVQERITGMNIVQTFNRQEKEYDKFKSINADHRDAHIRSVWATSIFFPVVEILSALSIAILILWGVLQLNMGEEDIGKLFGQLFAFILYIHMLYRPIRQLADRFNVLQMGMVGSERVFNILDTEAHIEDKGEVVHKEGLKGNISFQNVWFAYEEEEYVLRDISFEVKPGENVAIVGATGAGKSSIINLLSRFYEYQEGSIKIDDEDIQNYDLDFLRKNIAVVLQDVFLFSDTVMNNITLHDPSISRERVIEAAKAVGAHEFIQKLPGQYDYDVKERGGTISAGQRQLVAFIRAYVYDPSILILDEATSSVDTATENVIQKAILKVTENRTSIVIAHRLSTVRNADKIIVMDKGEVIEAGDHDSLMESGGYYKRLFDLQFKE